MLSNYHQLDELSPDCNGSLVCRGHEALISGEFATAKDLLKKGTDHDDFCVYARCRGSCNSHPSTISGSSLLLCLQHMVAQSGVEGLPALSAQIVIQMPE